MEMNCRIWVLGLMTSLERMVSKTFQVNPEKNIWRKVETVPKHDTVEVAERTSNLLALFCVVF